MDKLTMSVLAALLGMAVFCFDPCSAGNRPGRPGRPFTMCGTPPYKCREPNVCTNGKCECPPDTTGDGRVNCVPHDHHGGGISGDPVVHTLDNQTAHISYPCRYLLTDVKTTHYNGTSGGICKYKIYALNYFINDGYYIMGVDMELKIYDGPIINGVYESVAIRVQGFEKDGGFQYIEYGKSGPLGKMMPWGEKTSLDYLGIQVEATLDNDNIMHLSVPECGLILQFRAFVRGSQEWPGLVLGIHNRPGLEFVDHRDMMMSTPFNFEETRLQEVKHEFSLTLAQAALYLALNQDVPQDFGTGAIPCTIAGKQFLHVCATETKKAFALKMCSFLYTRKDIAKCLLSDAFGESVGSMFGLCVQAMCWEFAALCEDVKETLDCYHCIDVPDHFKNLACTQIHQEYASLYP